LLGVLLTPLEGEGAWGGRRGCRGVMRRVGVCTSKTLEPYEYSVSIIIYFQSILTTRRQYGVVILMDFVYQI